MAKTNKKSSAKRKLIPAVSMLTVSAVMLSTATYAWFTMSREVEVKNIKMTATVPEDTQISLGAITNPGTTGLAGGVGILSAGDGAAEAPSTGSTAADMLDWSNSADISAYYQFGKIIPASSINGTNIYYTPNATGVGRTIASDATFYKAVEGSTIYASGKNVEYNSATEGHDDARTALHALTANEKAGTSTWGETAPTGAHVTNDAGYYVDVPVWFRTSNADGVELKVDAYVTRGGDVDFTDDGDNLYKAVRIAIFEADADTTAGKANTNKTNLVKIKSDGYDSTKSVVDFYGRAANGLEDATQKGTRDAASAVNEYGVATYYDPAATSVVDLKTTAAYRGANGTYGNPKKYIIRVWLEGEDPNCWNPNAGQDFNLSLKFSADTVTAPTDLDDNATVSAYSAKNGDTYTFVFGSTNVVYTYNSATTAWETTTASLPSGTWKIGDTAIDSLDTLKSKISAKSPTTTVTVTAVTGG